MKFVGFKQISFMLAMAALFNTQAVLAENVIAKSKKQLVGGWKNEK